MGRRLSAVVAAYLEATDRRARRLAQRVEARLDEASRELGGSCTTICRSARQGLERSALGVRAAETRIANAALVAIERSQGRLVNRAQRLAGPAAQQLAVQAQHVAHRRELLQLLDPAPPARAGLVADTRRERQRRQVLGGPAARRQAGHDFCRRDRNLGRRADDEPRCEARRRRSERRRNPMSETEPATDLVAVAELGYGEASEELDAIIVELERGVIDVDLLEVRLRRAVEIVEELDRRIRGARDKVGSLLPRLEAVGQDSVRDDESR